MVVETHTSKFEYKRINGETKLRIYSAVVENNLVFESSVVPKCIEAQLFTTRADRAELSETT